MFNVGGLDGEKAALRLLLVLAYSQIPFPRLEFIKHAKEVGVGRTAFYSSLDKLKGLGLVEDLTGRGERGTVVESRLTERGEKVARLLSEIEEIFRRTQ